ncbi:hypothetical protein BDQ17DRAFT_1179653, partial [Cyathus striatus]
ECAITLGYTINYSTMLNYSSAFNSYLLFCKSHGFPTESTANTLSLYLVYMAPSLAVSTLTMYLSGIVKLLTLYYPNATQAHNSDLVWNTLCGCHYHHFSKPNCKPPLPLTMLAFICHLVYLSADYDQLLCLAILVTGFYGLLCLGELIIPDDPKLLDYRKYPPRHSVILLTNNVFQFTLPTHKVDQTFDGDIIIIQHLFSHGPDPSLIFRHYLRSRDESFPFHCLLWLRSNSHPPTHAFLLSFLHWFAGPSYSGHSLHSGGATALAEHGISPLSIQQIG